MTSALPLLSLDQVSVRYGQKLALRDASFAVHTGEIVTLLGESGSGKTTAARAIMGLVPVTSGTVTFEGRDITNLRGRARRAVWRQMQMVFQDPSASLSPRLDIGEIISEPLVAHGMSSAESRMRTAWLLDKVGLPASCIGRRAATLSGGQRQRVAIARALALNPRLVVADEPMSSLDVSVKAQIATLLLELRAETSTAFLIVAHDFALMAQIADRAVVLNEGKVIEQGPVDQVFGAPSHPHTAALRNACLDPFVLTEPVAA